MASIEPRPYRAYTRKDIDRIPQLQDLGADDIVAMKAVSAVLPFRTNPYVVEELIDWNNIPDDPIYQLTFPQPGMLSHEDFRRMTELVRTDAPEHTVRSAARKIQISLNPHPAGQMEMNVPKLDGEPLPGMQHKYRETVLFFPSQGQTCHAYCTYCFRWAQFVGIDELKFANREVESLVGYLRQHHEVRSVLFTGGDPLIMKTAVLRRYIEPLLADDLEHLDSIRIGTKATAYWPFRFLTDPDADDLLRLFEEVRAAGKNLSIMSHYSHPAELQTSSSRAAVGALLGAGVSIRCQAPLVRHVNDSADAWASLWRTEVQLGAIPYYMFMERDTGPKNYFEVPIVEAYRIFSDAYRRVSGLARTVRGPSMSATPGKVCIEGVGEINGEKVFICKFLQGRNPEWAGRVFFAKYDEQATWLKDLRPALGEKEFFFEAELRRMKQEGAQAWASVRPEPDVPRRIATGRRSD